MINSIHQSTLNCAFRCGEQFRRRYLMGEIIPPGIAAGRGTGVHKANEVNLKQKIHTKIDLDISDLKDVARDGYVNAFKNGVFLSKEDQPAKNRLLNEGLNQTLSLTELYRNEVAPEITPIDVEREFCIDVGLPLPLAGRIDMEEIAKINDLKTSGKKWPDDQIYKEIQPIFYSYVYEQETGIRPEFVYHILRTLKTGPKRQVQKLTPTDNHYHALFAKLKIFCKMLEAGTFLPADPTSWACDSKWCGYYYSCKFIPKHKRILPKRSN